jgi:uncharacterized protein YpmS
MARSLGKKQIPISKITRAIKEARSVAQLVEYLPRKYKVLTSNPKTTTTKKKSEL